MTDSSAPGTGLDAATRVHSPAAGIGPPATALVENLEAARLRTRTPGFGSEAGEPDELVSVLVTAVGVLLFAWTYLMHDPKIVEKRHDLLKALTGVRQNFVASTSELEDHLEAMQECSFLFAERNFEGKARSLRRFLEGVVTDPKHLVGDLPIAELLGPLRQFIQHWLETFKQCSPKPCIKPLQIATDAEVAECRDAVALAALMCEKLEDCDVNLLGKNLGRARVLTSLRAAEVVGDKDAEDDEPDDAGVVCTWFQFSTRSGYGWKGKSMDEDRYPFEVRMGLCHATVLSNLHVVIIVGLVASLVMFAIEAALLKLKCAGLMMVAMVAFTAASCRVEFVDEFAAAEKKLALMQKANQDVAEVREILLDYHNHAQEVADLHCLNTEPRLEYLDELFQRMEDASSGGHVRLDFLKVCNTSLDEVARAMAPVTAYVGEEAYPQLVLELACRQLRTHLDSITALRENASATERIIEQLGRPIFGMVVVRVIAAHKLENADLAILGGKSDPFVTVKIGQQEARTRAVQDSLDPVWASEPFSFELCGEDSVLELHVRDEDTMGRSDSLGLLRLDVREGLKRGCWQHMQGRLVDQKTGQFRGSGEIEYQVYYANEVTQMNWEAATY